MDKGAGFNGVPHITTELHVKNIPAKMKDSAIKNVLMNFGKVMSLKRSDTMATVHYEKAWLIGL